MSPITSMWQTYVLPVNRKEYPASQIQMIVNIVMYIIKMVSLPHQKPTTFDVAVSKELAPP